MFLDAMRSFPKPYYSLRESDRYMYAPWPLRNTALSSLSADQEERVPLQYTDQAFHAVRLFLERLHSYSEPCRLPARPDSRSPAERGTPHDAAKYAYAACENVASSPPDSAPPHPRPAHQESHKPHPPNHPPPRTKNKRPLTVRGRRLGGRKVKLRTRRGQSGQARRAVRCLCAASLRAAPERLFPGGTAGPGQ